MVKNIKNKGVELKSQAKKLLEKVFAKFLGMVGIASNKFFITFKRGFFLKVKRKFNKFKRNFKRLTGYSWEELLNAFTVASFIQISIKLMLSFFFFKLPSILWIFNLLLITQIALQMNWFFIFKQYLIKLIKNNLHPLVYDPNLPEDFHYLNLNNDELLYFGINKNKALIYFLLQNTLIFLIYIRLWVFSEPFLFHLSKVFILYWFLYDYNLTLAYLFSFIFIFSRFIIFLTDDNFYELKKPLLELKLLNHTQTIIKPTLKNATVIFFWVLRIIETKEKYKLAKTKKTLMSLNGYYYNYMLTIVERHNLQLVLVQREYSIFYKGIFVLLIFLVCFCFCPKKKL